MTPPPSVAEGQYVAALISEIENACGDDFHLRQHLQSARDLVFVIENRVACDIDETGQVSDLAAILRRLNPQSWAFGLENGPRVSQEYLRPDGLWGLTVRVDVSNVFAPTFEGRMEARRFRARAMEVLNINEEASQ